MTNETGILGRIASQAYYYKIQELDIEPLSFSKLNIECVLTITKKNEEILSKTLTKKTSVTLKFNDEDFSTSICINDKEFFRTNGIEFKYSVTNGKVSLSDRTVVLDH
jgi:hypothetical protein